LKMMTTATTTTTDLVSEWSDGGYESTSQSKVCDLEVPMRAH